jgi:hypothetical protein
MLMMIPDLDLLLLKTFVAVVETRSLTAAVCERRRESPSGKQPDCYRATG